MQVVTVETVRKRAVAVACAVLVAWFAAALPARAQDPEPPPFRYEVPRWLPAPRHPGSPAWRPHAGSRPSGHRPRAASAHEQVLAAVNARRERAGCPAVRPRTALDRVAEDHSAQMARRHRLVHADLRGRSLADRIEAAGYRLALAAENIAAGPATGKEAVAVWMGSRPHRRHIVNCRFTHAGVGVARSSGGPYWTLLLAARH
ncbi:CAP domain-containing protein [Streptomyces sp. NPDC059786]|uniref:CAP domain-containing protein n=1 Tax=Streptomyces sp. NPDC059786 TaxID=3346946 RepID=UPI0036470F1C